MNLGGSVSALSTESHTDFFSSQVQKIQRGSVRSKTNHLFMRLLVDFLYWKLPVLYIVIFFVVVCFCLEWDIVIV